MAKTYRKYAKKRAMRRRAKGKMRPSKPLVKVIKQVVRGQAETKVINCPQIGTTTNTVALAYNALTGLQYLVGDVFAVGQGIENNSGIGAANRIGDKIQALGFQLDYYFHPYAFYAIGGTSIAIPWVKLRVVVFEGKAQVANPLTNTLLFDQNFLNTNTSTLQPINYDNGFFQRILYDKVFVVKNNASLTGQQPTLNTLKPTGSCFHFKKYIPYKKLVQFTDTYAPASTNTKNPIYVAITAEVDDSQSGMVPSGTPIVSTTGFTRAWFKDF